jgi:uncharacterized SAM-binding protein YcdF (DUF218 family)
MIEILKSVGPPGSPMFFAVALAIGLFILYAWPRHRLIARIWLLTLVGGHIVMALPVVADSVAEALGPYRHDTGIHQTQTLVVLDGDNRRGRVRAARQAYETSPSAPSIVLGDDWMVDDLVEAGVPPSQIRVYTSTTTTREQMLWVRSYLASHPGTTAAVIASRLQMPRVAALAESMYIQAALLPSPVDAEPARAGIRRYIPSYAALRVTRDAIYEHVALAYYKWRGWIGPRPSGASWPAGGTGALPDVRRA